MISTVHQTKPGGKFPKAKSII